MRKQILFVTCNGVTDQAFGGAKASIRNYMSLKKMADVDVYTIVKKSSMKSVISLLRGYYPPVCDKDYQYVKNQIESKKYDAIFFDGSYFGKLAKRICKKGVKTIVFFHNCELDYIDVRFGKGNSLKKWIYKKSIYFNEKIITTMGDYRIAFSERDAKRIEELYGTKVEKIAPLSIVDIFEQKDRSEKEPYCLLLGPLGTANEEGFAWFVKNVSSKLNCKTVIVGKGFEKYKSTWENKHIEVLGFVEDLTQVYADAACVSIPLFSGAGMKIKTAEALMFGKYVFGTTEAFEGYQLEMNEVGGLCNDAQSFIDSINNLLESKTEFYNQDARNVYIKKYSLAASDSYFREVFSAIWK